MAASRSLLLLSAVALAAVGPASAWSPALEVRMTDEAVRLMPASLRLALERHREELRRGLLTPALEEDGPAHRAPWAGGSLDASVESAALELRAALEGLAPFGEVAAAFGTLGHFVLDAGFPPGAGEGGAGRRYDHFAAFCDSRVEKFPLVFYGHADATLEAGDYRGFALAVLRRASAEDGTLARAYAAAGDPPDPAAFDDRSVPFAVASLAYSRAVTDLSRVWLAVWRSAGGDVGRTPYLAPPAGAGPHPGRP